MMVTLLKMAKMAMNRSDAFKKRRKAMEDKLRSNARKM